MVNDIISLLIPHIILILTILIQMTCALVKLPAIAFKYKNVNITTSNIISFAGLLSAIIAVGLAPSEYSGFSNTILIKPYVPILANLILISGVATIMLSSNLLKENRQNCYKFHILLLTALIGAITTIQANDFLTLFVSLETLSICLYFLIAYARGYQSKEASFKYLITNAVSMAFFLFGVSYLLGMTSSLNFTEIEQSLDIFRTNGMIYTISILFIFFGISMKLAIFPFANWVLEVFEGSTSSILNLLITVPKVAVLGVLLKLFENILSASFELCLVVLFLALCTAFWANIYAIKNSNFKRVLACSTSANAAYLVILLTIATVSNYGALMFYLICYVFMNIGVCAYLNIVEEKAQNFNMDKLPRPENIFILCGYVICVLGLAGLPISSGFFAKIYLLYALLNSGLIFIPVIFILLVLFALAIVYYIKMLKIVSNPVSEITLSKNTSVIFMISSLITFVLGVVPFGLISFCAKLF